MPRILFLYCFATFSNYVLFHLVGVQSSSLRALKLVLKGWVFRTDMKLSLLALNSRCSRAFSIKKFTKLIIPRYISFNFYKKTRIRWDQKAIINFYSSEEEIEYARVQLNMKINYPSFRIIRNRVQARRLSLNCQFDISITTTTINFYSSEYVRIQLNMKINYSLFRNISCCVIRNRVQTI